MAKAADWAEAEGTDAASKAAFTGLPVPIDGPEVGGDSGAVDLGSGP